MSGSRNHVIPGARIVWIVTMKLSPGRIEENRVMNTAVAAGTTIVLENIVENGGKNVQPVSIPPKSRIAIAIEPPIMKMYHDIKLSQGKARSRAPIMSGTRKF